MLVPMTHVTSLMPKNVLKTKKLFFPYFCIKRKVMMVPMTYVTSLMPKNVLKTKKTLFLFLHEAKSDAGSDHLCDVLDAKKRFENEKTFSPYFCMK